jgi:hypothetical protein
MTTFQFLYRQATLKILANVTDKQFQIIARTPTKTTHEFAELVKSVSRSKKVRKLVDDLIYLEETHNGVKAFESLFKTA